MELVGAVATGSLASNLCSWLDVVLVVVDVVEVDGCAAFGGGAYCMQVAARGDAGAGDVVLDATLLLPEWWFSVCLRNDLASQYDFPQPSALHSYGFLLRCVSMWPFL